MKNRIDLLGIYGPDLVVLGLVVVLGVIVSSSVELIEGWQSAGGVVGLIAVRLVAQWRALVQRAGGAVLRGVMAVTIKPLKRVAGLILGSPVGIAVIGLVVAGVLGWLGWRATDERPIVVGGVALIAAGVGGQWWWYRRRLAEWRAANP